ncbi:DNA mismatch repair protein MutL [Cyphellophora attinorum]|uniref:DNA mismatch repair protein MutL n=1 Tax=Cyphellophora attinorum TaxID=1664694 RepID=A0A0N0NRH8_9EURO|nr:DNA mismatch repair protein MutL [Phialophora attinorum]KPI45098.1 DNA mismatch repair protein MutL [Phialophora attinorum]
MPIAVLPQETVRVLTSSVALNDAVSVVKELVDNALDASATAITIEISTNTIDTIQVKDNGRGIGIEDRQLLCKRGCTSKIRTIEDLTTLGGRSLGFRGEALASVVNTSDAVLITTRIEGEMVGTALKFGANGKMLSSSSASHAVGTTVRVQNFLSNVPVRKQTVLKSTSKILSSIRKLLLSYAFARPETRFTLKVLKAKSDKLNWSYAPGGSKSTLSENAVKIIGKEAASQTIQIHSPDTDSGDTQTMTALVIDPKSDVEKACNIDSYFSVDKRPITTDRDVMRDLHKMYRSYLRNTICDVENIKVSKPFIALQLSCPPECYDVNVEPAKDRIMFYDQKTVIDLFEGMMIATYGELTKNDVTARVPRPAAGPTPFEVLLATPRQMSPVHAKSFATSPTRDGDAGPTDTILANAQSPADKLERRESFDNPWTKAKMNVRLAPKIWATEQPDSPVAEGTNIGSTPSAESTTPRRMSSQDFEQLPTPEPSSDPGQPAYQNPGPPMRRRERQLSDSEAENERPAGSPARGPTLLDGWIRAQQLRSDDVPSQVDNPSSGPATICEPGVGTEDQHMPKKTHRTQDSSTSSTMSMQATSRRGGLVQKPVATPFQRPRLSQFPDTSASQMIPAATRPRAANLHAHHPPLSGPEATSELDDILEFERQKRVVAEQRKQAMRRDKGHRTSASHLEQPSLRSILKVGSNATGHVDTMAGNIEDFSSQFEDDGTDNLVEPPHPRMAAYSDDLSLVKSQPVTSRSAIDRTEHSGDGFEAHFPAKQDLSAEQSATKSFSLSDSDPRSHLFRQREIGNHGNASSAAGLTRTGLKIRRIKTTRLPLEIIPTEYKTNDLAIELMCLGYEDVTAEDGQKLLACLRASAAELKTSDEHVKSGSVSAVDWASCEGKIEGWSRVVAGALQKLKPDIEKREVEREIALSMQNALTQEPQVTT